MNMLDKQIQNEIENKNFNIDLEKRYSSKISFKNLKVSNGNSKVNSKMDSNVNNNNLVNNNFNLTDKETACSGSTNKKSIQKEDEEEVDKVNMDLYNNCNNPNRCMSKTRKKENNIINSNTQNYHSELDKQEQNFNLQTNFNIKIDNYSKNTNCADKIENCLIF